MVSENIRVKVRKKFVDPYPNTDKQFKEHIEYFVGFIVDETIKEIKKNV